MKNMMYVILLAMAAVAAFSLMGCSTTRSVDDVSTCTVTVKRVDAVGVQHIDCIVYVIPKEIK